MSSHVDRRDVEYAHTSWYGLTCPDPNALEGTYGPKDMHWEDVRV